MGESRCAAAAAGVCLVLAGGMVGTAWARQPRPPAEVDMQRPATGGDPNVGEQPRVYRAQDLRLDGTPANPEAGSFLSCMISGTYDRNAWDKNFDPTLRDPALISGLGPHFRRAGVQSAEGADIQADPADDRVDPIEIMQWSWAERARCQKTIGTTSAIATGLLGLTYLIAQDRHGQNDRAVTGRDLTRLGVLTLIPVMMDDLRAVGQTRRYYTSAVLGTSLMMTRNETLVRLADELDALPTAASAQACQPLAVPTFQLHSAAIDPLQARLLVDIAAYQDWCRSFATLQTKVWVLQAQNESHRADFTMDRRDAWRVYANAVNTGGYEQKATTAGVLHKVITLPLTAATDVLGGDKPGDFKLGNDRTKLTLTDAVTLPLFGGDFDYSRPTGDIVALSAAIVADARAVGETLDGYKVTKGDKTAAANLKKDRAALDPFRASGRVLPTVMGNAVTLSRYFDKADGVITAIKARNTQRYLILDLNAGGAYLGLQSIGDLAKTAPKADAAAGVAAKASSAAGG